MKGKYILAIDQGTTGTTVCLMDRRGRFLGKENKEFEQVFPQPGWVEHDLENIWKSTVSTINRVIQKTKINSKEIIGIGITNQRETVGIWNRQTGKPIYNAIVWQCRRTAKDCERIKKTMHREYIEKTTGLVIDPYFSATKIGWLLKNVKGAREQVKKGNLVAGNIDTFLLWRLTGGKTHKTDISNASRTQLMNLKTGKWDHKLLKIFSISKDILPEISSNNSVFGFTEGVKGLPDGIPISGMIGDQQAALFGQACFEAGEAKCTYGTGSFLLMNTGHKIVSSENRLLTTVAWQLEGKGKITYALEGGAFVCGSAVQWLRDGLGIIKKSSDIESLAEKVESSEGVEFIPALTGLGAPHWKPEARGNISGLTRGTTVEHIARATLDGMALQNVEILNCMQRDAKKKLKSLKVDGGACTNNLLMQIQSDLAETILTRPQITETTAAGAAYMAGLGIGFWKNLEEIRQICKEDKAFHPQRTKRQVRERLRAWQLAVERSTLSRSYKS